MKNSLPRAQAVRRQVEPGRSSDLENGEEQAEPPPPGVPAKNGRHRKPTPARALGGLAKDPARALGGRAKDPAGTGSGPASTTALARKSPTQKAPEIAATPPNSAKARTVEQKSAPSKSAPAKGESKVVRAPLVSTRPAPVAPPTEGGPAAV